MSADESYYRERFEAQRRLAMKVAPFLEVNEILEKARDEIRRAVPDSMEVCILLLDPDASRYTRPLQCALHERPVSCLACKRSRPAIQKALKQRRGVIASKSDPIERSDGSRVEIGPEAAIPVFVDQQVLAVLSVVKPPGARFGPRDFHLIQDYSETLGNLLLNARKHWATTQEKIRISQMLTQLSPFVPKSVRAMVHKDPQLLAQEKKKRSVSVLFLDMEGYTGLSSSRTDTEVNAFVEQVFSSFVDPIHRSHGEINETAGDGLMIIFQAHDACTNAANSVKAAFEIYHRNQEVQRELGFSAEPVPVNLGINSGEALVGMSRFAGALDARMTYTASGPVTNLAARFADCAEGGDILIGEETRKFIAGLWPTYDRGAVNLKGVAEPVRIHSLLREGRVPPAPPAAEVP